LRVAGDGIGNLSARNRQKIGSSGVRVPRASSSQTGIGNGAERLEDIMRTIVIFAAALSFSAAVSAAEPLPTNAVNIGDVNLGTSNGQRVLARRVAAAVEEVCGSYANVNEYYQQVLVDRCRTAAMASAHQQIASKSTALRIAAGEKK
jgi:UrcA family protein